MKGKKMEKCADTRLIAGRNDDAAASPVTAPAVGQSTATQTNEYFAKETVVIMENKLEVDDYQPQQHKNALISMVGSKPQAAGSSSIPSICDRSKTNIGVSLPGSEVIGAGANAFSQLVRGWESFMRDQQQIDPFANMKQHMLHGLSHVSGAHRLDHGQKSGKESTLFHPMTPPSLRHSQSTPTRQTRTQHFLPSMLNLNPDCNTHNEDVPPPPIALDPFQRSTSTPSAFRQHSYYSTFGAANNSAFSHPLKRSAFSGIPTTTTNNEPGAVKFSSSAFGPVQFYSMALEDMERDMERTSIEVEMEDASPSHCQEDIVVDMGSKRGAASRAARFLSDVRILRRRKKNRNRDGREKPVQLPPVTSSASKVAEDLVSNSPPTIDTAVTVITEPHADPNEISMFSTSSEISVIVRNHASNSEALAIDSDDRSVSSVAASLERTNSQPEEMKHDGYHELESDAEDNYRRFETISPPVLTQTFEKFANERLGSNTTNSRSDLQARSSTMQGMVASSTKSRFSFADSASLVGMERGDGSCLTPRSIASSRSSVTGSSLGHTTQATNNSSGTSTGLQSGLSTISETDREVMETNQEAKRRSLDNLLTTISKNSENDGISTNSGSSSSTNPHRYFSLASSPENLREGANVPVGQLFSDNSPSNRSASTSPGSQVGEQLGRTHTIGASTITSRRSVNTNITSPSATSGSISAARTSSTSSSSAQPPKFVSYVDQEASMLRGEFMEMSSPRAPNNNGEEREASPAAQMLGNSDLSFEVPLAPFQTTSSFMFRDSRLRPPRSPGKGNRLQKTPPPHGSVSPLYHHLLSPPRDIVDHPDASNVSRPYVMRSGLALRNSVLVTTRSDMGPTMSATEQFDSGEIRLVKGRTYQESSIEIMNTDEADTTANVVTPEKYCN